MGKPCLLHSIKLFIGRSRHEQRIQLISGPIVFAMIAPAMITSSMIVSAMIAPDMKVDLHCHSHFSDGKHPPAELIQRALQNNVTHLAITDHDCTAALNDINTLTTDIEIINGVELSCDWQGSEVHIVGLLIDPRDPGMTELLAAQQQKRSLRMQGMDTKLELLGHQGLLSYLQELPCIAFTRSHVADFLVARGICKNRQKAFKTHLGKRGKIYVGVDWCSLTHAITEIKNAGGIAVLAHPGRYPLSKRRLETLVEDFSAAGGEALEASYSNIEPRSKLHLSELASAHQLYVSVGSDFHDAAAHWTDIGKFPALDQHTQKNAIWCHPRWHFSNS
jgi:predicted metal-dependent phosphoesterase TrpH